MQTFDSIVGNFNTVNLLRRDICIDGTGELLLFHGVVGTGKTSTAKIYAMAYTCEQPSANGNACGECSQCKINRKALESGQDSTRIVVKNMGTYKDFKELVELMEEVFVLQTSERVVYILDEFHLLPEGLQSSFLTEIDNMQENVKIILTTTHMHKINRGLRSRSNQFMFSKLTIEESRKLLQIKFNAMPFTEEVFKTLVASSDYIPRNILKNSSFLIKVGADVNEQLAFLQHISSESFLEILEATLEGQVAVFRILSSQMAEKSEPTNIHKTFIQFLLECVYIHYGDTSYGTPKYRKKVKELMTAKEYLRIMNLLDNTATFSNPESLDLFLFKILVSNRPSKVAEEITNVVEKAEIKDTTRRQISRAVIDKSNEFTEL